MAYHRRNNGDVGECFRKLGRRAKDEATAAETFLQMSSHRKKPASALRGSSKDDTNAETIMSIPLQYGFGRLDLVDCSRMLLSE